MSRLFDDAASQYLELDSAPVSAYPLTMACWFYSDNVVVSQTLLAVLDKDVNTHYHQLMAAGLVGGDPVRYTAYGGVAPGNADTTAGFSADTWHHACAVGTNATTRAVYLDGGNKGTNASNITPANLDRISIGRRGSSAPDHYMSGRIAEAAIWNAALTDDEVALLAAGYSPLFVRPESLVAYWPLIRDDDLDRVGNYNLADTNGPTIDEHVPILNPAAVHVGKGAEEATTSTSTTTSTTTSSSTSTTSSSTSTSQTQSTSTSTTSSSTSTSQTQSTSTSLTVSSSTSLTSSSSSTSTQTVSTSTSTSTTSSSISTSTSTTTTLDPTADCLAFGEQFPNPGEDPVSWQTWSDGAAGVPTVEGNPDWGKMVLDAGEQGRSRVYDFGNSVDRTFDLTIDKYGVGQGTATWQLRGQNAPFTQDQAAPPNWENYVGGFHRTWRYWQLRAVK